MGPRTAEPPRAFPRLRHRCPARRGTFGFVRRRRQSPIVHEALGATVAAYRFGHSRARASCATGGAFGIADLLRAADVVATG